MQIAVHVDTSACGQTPLREHMLCCLDSRRATLKIIASQGRPPRDDGRAGLGQSAQRGAHLPEVMPRRNTEYHHTMFKLDLDICLTHTLSELDTVVVKALVPIQHRALLRTTIPESGTLT